MLRSLPPRSRLAALALIALALAPSVAAAQPESLEARENRGVALRAEGRTAEALEIFREVFEAGHLPRTQARLGLAETALGRWVSAETDLQTALDAAADPFVVANRRALESTLATVRAHLGSFEVLCSQPGAEVWIEGHRAASLPMSAPMRVVAGSTPVELRAEGFYPVVRTLTVAAGQIVRESVELTPVQTREGVGRVTPTVSRRVTPPLAPPLAPPLTPPLTPPVTVPPRREPPAHGSARRTAGWWTLGGAGLFGLGGAVALGLQRSVGTQFNNECSSMYTGELSERCDTLAGSANTAGALAITGFAVGGALAIVTAVLWIPSSSARSAARTVCGPGPGTLGVSCVATF